MDMQKRLEIFADLSGDYNPVHLNPQFAKDSYFGTQIIYGIYQVFFALEQTLSKLPCLSKPLNLLKIKAIFHSPISLDSALDMKIKGSLSTNNAMGGGDKNDSNKHPLEKNPYPKDKIYQRISSAKSIVLKSNSKHLNMHKSFQWEGGIFLKKECASTLNFTLSEILPDLPNIDLDFQKIPQTSTEDLSFDFALLKKLFPICATYLHPTSIATLLASTRIVGMKTPGLHSIYSSLSLSYVHTETPSHTLHYTHQTHPLLNLTTLKLLYPMQGVIKAFCRPQKRSNPTFASLTALHSQALKSQPFKSQKALIIGASSGLGNACTKLLALGGAKVLATSQNHRFDETHPHLSTLSLNALKLTHENLRSLQSFNPTHLYYFATPPITSHNENFNPKRFFNFLKYYVIALSRIIQSLPNLQGIFQPSSIFIEELPLDFCEYTLAKATLESYGHYLAKKGFCIAMPRLPKIATNQTLSLIPQTLQTPSIALIDELLTFADKTLKRE